MRNNWTNLPLWPLFIDFKEWAVQDDTGNIVADGFDSFNQAAEVADRANHQMDSWPLYRID